MMLYFQHLHFLKNSSMYTKSKLTRTEQKAAYIRNMYWHIGQPRKGQ